MGETARQRAEQLHEQVDRRRMRFHVDRVAELIAVARLHSLPQQPGRYARHRDRRSSAGDRAGMRPSPAPRSQYSCRWPASGVSQVICFWRLGWTRTSQIGILVSVGFNQPFDPRPSLPRSLCRGTISNSADRVLAARDRRRPAQATQLQRAIEEETGSRRRPKCTSSRARPRRSRRIRGRACSPA